MKKLIYSALLLATGFGLVACQEEKDVVEMDMLDGINMVVRSTSIADGTTTKPLDVITVDYNNLVGIDASKSATLNGKPLTAAVNDENGMQLVIPIQTEWNTEYVFEIPAGMIYRRDDSSVAHEGLTINFNTKLGTDKNKVDANLTNPNATAEAKAVYAQMLEDYGTLMYSGAMGGVAWETGYTDFINGNNAGAGYPKVVGFDYIHLASSPSNWIDYGNITPVQKVWLAGSIPTITWHWNVPAEPITDDFVYNPNKLDFNSTTFSATKALTPGTKENEIINADIEKVAGYMKLLQNAGIPVLFRPFHEAAGDYAWGAWFWWGRDGVDATKQLWKYLRDKLEGEYGLNNLIWVWTVQTSEAGQPASLETIRNAYPGDELVDIVGVDLYPDYAMTDQTEQFTLVNSMVDGKKMVALSEVGNLVDPAAAAENHALWSYFMNWYDTDASGKSGFGTWNTQSVTIGDTTYPNPWAAVANSPYVLNRK